MKKCSNCFQFKEYSEFYTRVMGNGKTYYQSRCKECNKEVCAGYKKRKREKLWSLYEG